MSKISVIIPVYNVENYLDRCINSVINQTYKDLEILLINDGSTDRSGEICDYYKNIDSRIKVIHKSNGGVSSARNIGLNIATGEWIAFLDSDDYIESNMYEELYNDAIENNVDVCACFFKYLTSDNKILFNPTKEHNDLNKKYSGEQFLKLLYTDLYTNLICVVVWNKIYKKKVFENISFVSKIAEDEDICHKIYTQEMSIFTNIKGLYIYAQNMDSITNKKFSSDNMEFLDILYNRILSFEKNDLIDLAKVTRNLYLNMIIEYYFKIKSIKKKYNFSQYMNNYKEQLKVAIKLNDISFKDKIRFCIFRKSPFLYGKIIKYISRKGI